MSSKNSKKTMNERTHNSQELYKNPTVNPDTEMGIDFAEVSKNKVTKHINKESNNKK
ncbi:hypothetical protein [Psychrobacillus sp. NPDC093200]|uniref:hypothetical protein n=1 Tax=Psychrobacillus sp. NPDC093200 TaxID=3390656 RepID=UPI003D0319A9